MFDSHPEYNTEFLDKVRLYVQEKHKDQKYGSKEYYFHLLDVETKAFLSLLNYRIKYSDNESLINEVRSVALLHDVIEDTDATHQELVYYFGYQISGAANALSVPKGLNRKTRNKTIWKNIERLSGPTKKIALLVKVADRVSNVENCRETKNHKLFMYKKEHESFSWHLKTNQAAQGNTFLDESIDLLFKDLEKLLGD